MIIIIIVIIIITGLVDFREEDPVSFNSSIRLKGLFLFCVFGVPEFSTFSISQYNDHDTKVKMIITKEGGLRAGGGGGSPPGGGGGGIEFPGIKGLGVKGATSGDADPAIFGKTGGGGSEIPVEVEIDPGARREGTEIPMSGFNNNDSYYVPFWHLP